jgi:hypothetical protein
MHDCVHLRFLSHVLLVGLSSEFVGVVNLPLDLTLVENKLFELNLVCVSFEVIGKLFVTQHRDVDLGVLLL